MREISPTDDIIDSRDVDTRIEELRGIGEEEYYEQGGLSDDDDLPTDFDASAYMNEDDADEYRNLLDLADEGRYNVAEWDTGATLISEDYFEEYAQQMAEDIGAIDRDAGWPLGFIDWEAASTALKIDYSRIEFDGAEFWGRS